MPIFGPSRIHDFRGQSSLATWLSRIVINEALRRLGKRRATVELSAIDHAYGTEAAADARPVTPSPEEQAARRELRHIVERAVDALPTPFRIVFILRVMERASIEETAGTLGIPEATVKTRPHRANQMLRRRLGSELALVFDEAFPFGGARCEKLTEIVLARLCPDVATWHCRVNRDWRLDVVRRGRQYDIGGSFVTASSEGSMG